LRYFSSTWIGFALSLFWLKLEEYSVYSATIGGEMESIHQSVERIDPLTGSGNLLSFLETFTLRLAAPDHSEFSLLMVDLNNFMQFNRERGHQQGDAILHWVSIAMRDTRQPVYRIGGDEILAVLDQGTLEEREIIARGLYERLNRESVQFDWTNPASVMLIHFQKEKLEIADLWIAISDALFDVKIYEKRGFVVNTYASLSGSNNYQMRVLNMLTERLLSFATRLDATHQIAYLDPVTQLPNSVAAEKEMRRAIEDARRGDKVFSILFIDGDNLRLYNDISYSAGDKMLIRLAELMANHLRPGDFIARWRVGDEFLVLLPGAKGDEAHHVAERLRSEVEAQSMAWEIPVTISIGIACYPGHGSTMDELLHSVEKAAKFSKDHGKNQIALAID
jgi:diguanylate cyclase (GGDEF)-like protein